MGVGKFVEHVRVRSDEVECVYFIEYVVAFFVDLLVDSKNN